MTTRAAKKAKKRKPALVELHEFMGWPLAQNAMRVRPEAAQVTRADLLKLRSKCGHRWNPNAKNNPKPKDISLGMAILARKILAEYVGKKLYLRYNRRIYWGCFPCALDACTRDADSIQNTAAVGCCECQWMDKLARDWAEGQNDEKKE